MNTNSAIQYPISPYEVTGYGFGSRIRSRGIFIARHLGHDILTDPGTSVFCILDGVVVWSEIRSGSAQKKNWGGIVIVEHVHADTSEKFYSVYGHIKDLKIKIGDSIKKGEEIGVVAGGSTPENGFWKLAHLHFGIYVGPWTGSVLPGWLRPFEGRTKLSWWKDPKVFIDAYNSALE